MKCLSQICHLALLLGFERNDDASICNGLEKTLFANKQIGRECYRFLVNVKVFWWEVRRMTLVLCKHNCVLTLGMKAGEARCTQPPDRR